MSAANALSSDKSPPTLGEPRASEPSMEDILASIRRIIADDQSRHTGASGAVSGGAASAGIAPTGSRRTVAPPSTEAAASPGAGRPPTVVAEPPRLSDMPALRDRLGPLPPRDPTEPLVTPNAVSSHLNPPPLPPNVDLERTVIAEITSAGIAAARQPAPAPLGAASREAASPGSLAAIADPAEPATAPRAAPEGEPAQSPPPKDDASTDGPPPDPSTTRPEAPVATEPLVSPTADASIESSFTALATSVFMQNTGLVESMVKDLLKPMLTSWLESNLPTIVERLVRIEIERVARGGRT